MKPSRSALKRPRHLRSFRPFSEERHSAEVAESHHIPGPEPCTEVILDRLDPRVVILYGNRNLIDSSLQTLGLGEKVCKRLDFLRMVFYSAMARRGITMRRQFNRYHHIYDRCRRGQSSSRHVLAPKKVPKGPSPKDRSCKPGCICFPRHVRTSRRKRL